RRLTERARAALAVPDRALATRCPHGRGPRVLGAAPGRCRRIRPRARALGGRVAVHALAAALASRLHAPPRARRTPLRPLPPLSRGVLRRDVEGPARASSAAPALHRHPTRARSTAIPVGLAPGR